VGGLKLKSDGEVHQELLGHHSWIGLAKVDWRASVRLMAILSIRRIHGLALPAKVDCGAS
jgi:hypothetical protein